MENRILFLFTPKEENSCLMRVQYMPIKGKKSKEKKGRKSKGREGGDTRGRE